MILLDVMIKLNEFQILKYDQKKDILIWIFEQLQNERIEWVDFDDTIFLLKASDKIKTETLDNIYFNIIELLKTNKNNKYAEYQNKLMEIQVAMMKDHEIESEEADKLLDDL